MTETVIVKLIKMLKTIQYMSVYCYFVIEMKSQFRSLAMISGLNRACLGVF